MKRETNKAERASEETAKYKTLVDEISAGFIKAAEDSPADRFAPMMLACDVAAETILSGYPRDQWEAVLGMFLDRLGNAMDRRAEGTAQ